MKNLVLITLDACRKDVFGFYGSKAELTPFMNSLEGRSIVFTKAQAIGPYTQSSFPGILTSSYYLEYGWQQRCSPQRLLVSEVLKRNGILTAGFHSNPYLSGYFGWNRGWDEFMDSMDEKVTPKTPFLKGDKLNGKIEDWLSSNRRRIRSEPLFLWVHYMDIHEPYIPQQKHLHLVDSEIALSEDGMFKLFKDLLLNRDTSDLEKVDLLRKLYDAHVREVDDYVRDLFDMLASLDLLKDSVIIITSDHGDEFNEHGGLSHDDKMYSELIDIPLLIYDPRRKKGEENDTLVSNIDIPPTIVHLFGLDPVDSFEGQSLLPSGAYSEKGCFGEALLHIKGKGADIEKDIYYYREGDLKIIYRASLDAWELYDLKHDPKELKNIFHSCSETHTLRARLQPRVRRWETKTKTREDNKDGNQ